MKVSTCYEPKLLYLIVVTQLPINFENHQQALTHRLKESLFHYKNTYKYGINWEPTLNKSIKQRTI